MTLLFADVGADVAAVTMLGLTAITHNNIKVENTRLIIAKSPPRQSFHAILSFLATIAK
jgi:hypothetical protein